MIGKEFLGVLSSINFETELLEALEWDEEKLESTTQKLIEYFNVCSKTDLDLIKVDLGFIFSEEISNIIMKYVTHIKLDVVQQGEDNETGNIFKTSKDHN
jgi:hypothetical protein